LQLPPYGSLPETGPTSSSRNAFIPFPIAGYSTKNEAHRQRICP
jgi:hypothetical protein